MVFPPASVPEGFQRASGKPFGAPAGAYPLLREGNDAPTAARVMGLPPRGGDSTFFRRERKYQRKHAARRLREKALYCPFCRRGSLCRAQHGWADFTCVRARSELAFFRRQNGRAFFPPLPIAALAPVLGAGHTYTLRLGMLRCGLDIFATQNASVVSNPRWHFYASHEARRRMAVFAIQLAWSHTRPASREACRRAAVSPQSTSMSRCHPARPRRAVRKGTQSPSSTSTKKGWPQCSHTGLSSKSMSEARIITVCPQLGQSKESS